MFLLFFWSPVSEDCGCSFAFFHDGSSVFQTAESQCDQYFNLVTSLIFGLSQNQRAEFNYGMIKQKLFFITKLNKVKIK